MNPCFSEKPREDGQILRPVAFEQLMAFALQGTPEGLDPAMCVVAEFEPLLFAVASSNAPGIAILPPSDVPGGTRIAMFADPAGNIVGLMQRRSSVMSQRWLC